MDFMVTGERVSGDKEGLVCCVWGMYILTKIDCDAVSTVGRRGDVVYLGKDKERVMVLEVDVSECLKMRKNEQCPRRVGADQRV